MPTIVGISGSLRRGSHNTMLLRAAASMAPPDVRIDIASIRDVPLYDGDLEERGVPAAVEDLKDRVAAADGLLLVTPEYNHGVPGVLKNAIDWLTRPERDIPRVFGGRCVGVIGATPGRGGTALAQAAWLPVLRTLGTQPYFGERLLVGRAAEVFDERGTIVDDTVRRLLARYVSGFARFVVRNAQLTPA